MRDAIGPIVAALVTLAGVLWTQRANTRAKREYAVRAEIEAKARDALDRRTVEGEAYDRARDIDTETINRLRAAVEDLQRRLASAEQRVEQLETDRRADRDELGRTRRWQRAAISYIGLLRQAMRDRGIPVPVPPPELQLEGLTE